jgi:hypothetical protein
MLSPLLSLTLLLGGVGTPAAPFDDALYRDSIAPLFEARCGKCHNPETSRGDLDLSRPGAVAAGGARGSLLGEGAETWEAALLWRAVSYEEVELRMPPRGKLPEGELALIEHWLKAGAPLPEDASTGPGRNSARNTRPWCATRPGCATRSTASSWPTWKPRA